MYSTFQLQLLLEAGSSIDITFCDIIQNIQDSATSNPRQRTGCSYEMVLKMIEEALQLSERKPRKEASEVVYIIY